MSKKSILTAVISLALVAAVSVGATLAYLSSQTGAITNTFTIGDVTLTMEETYDSADMPANSGGSPTTGYDVEYTPQGKFTKNPTLTVTGGSVEAYVFLEVTATSNFFMDAAAFDPQTREFVPYTFAADQGDWKYLNDPNSAANTYVYYLETPIAAAAADTVLEGPFDGLTFMVNPTLENEIIPGTNNGTFTFVGKAIQALGFDTADAAYAQFQ